MKKPYRLVLLTFIFGIVLSMWLTLEKKANSEPLPTISSGPVSILKPNDSPLNLETEPFMIDVPLENQFDEPALENGCEITGLSMLLQYHGFDTNKNELADLLDYVPVYTEEGFRGDPHEGFVGDIVSGDNAMGVAMEPIAKVAQEVVGDRFEIVASSSTPFAEIESLVRAGSPVWVLTTVDFRIPTEADFKDWETVSGTIQVTPLCHAGVIVGVDATNVFINDPFGEQKAIPKSRFITVYKAMGQQSLYLK